MKSKRLLSLAMAAVMSVSALGYCASIRTPVGIVASAEVNYNPAQEVKMPDIMARVTYSKEELEKMWKEGNAKKCFKDVYSDDPNFPKHYKDYIWLNKGQIDAGRYHAVNPNTDGVYEKGNKVTAEEADLTRGYKIPFWALKLKTDYKETLYYKFYGWEQVQDDKWLTGDRCEDASHALNYTDTDNVTVSPSGDSYIATFHIIVKTYLTDEAIAEHQAEMEKKSAEKKETNKVTDYVSSKAGKWNGSNNVFNTKTYKVETQKLGQTKDNGCIVGVKYVPRDGNGHYTQGDVKYLFNLCGVTDVEEAFLYDVYIPEPYQLIDGKNIVVKLDMPKGYSTEGYNVYLYHMVNGKAKRIRKIGWRSFYVVFASNSFSPYVLVLTPKGQKRGVASTGEVLYANPPTGEGDVVPVAMLAATALCTSCLLTVRKRRELEV